MCNDFLVMFFKNVHWQLWLHPFTLIRSTLIRSTFSIQSSDVLKQFMTVLLAYGLLFVCFISIHFAEELHESVGVEYIDEIFTASCLCRLPHAGTETSGDRQRAQ